MLFCTYAIICPHKAASKTVSFKERGSLVLDVKRFKCLQFLTACGKLTICTTTIQMKLCSSSRQRNLKIHQCGFSCRITEYMPQSAAPPVSA